MDGRLHRDKERSDEERWQEDELQSYCEESNTIKVTRWVQLMQTLN